jgi:hypothetical protein
MKEDGPIVRERGFWKLGTGVVVENSSSFCVNMGLEVNITGPIESESDSRNLLLEEPARRYVGLVVVNHSIAGLCVVLSLDPIMYDDSGALRVILLSSMSGGFEEAK